MANYRDVVNTDSNKYHISELIINDFVDLTKNIRKPFLKHSSRRFTDRMGAERTAAGGYIAGRSISFKALPMPEIGRGVIVKISPYTERTYTITMQDKWNLQHTRGFGTADDQTFFINKAMRIEAISAPILKQMLNKAERDMAQVQLEHAPIFPSFGTPIDQEIDLTKIKIDYAWIAHLKKLYHHLQIGGEPKLFLNLNDDMRCSNSLTHLYHEPMVGKAVQYAELPRTLAGFPIVETENLDYHECLITGAKGPFYFKTLPTKQDGNAILVNQTGATVTLRAGDVLYHKAATTNSSDGLHWVMPTNKSPIYDTRFSFVVTNEKYVSTLTNSQIEELKYENVLYPISAGGEATISFSHDAVSPDIDVNFQNVNRPIRLSTDANPDAFYVLQSHYKNILANKRYTYFDSFTVPGNTNNPFHYYESKEGDAARLSILCQSPSTFTEGARRANLLDFFAAPIHFNVAQCTLMLPSDLESNIVSFPDLTAKKGPSASNTLRKAA